MYNRDSNTGKKGVLYKRRNTINEINNKEGRYNKYSNIGDNNSHRNSNSWHDEVSLLK